MNNKMTTCAIYKNTFESVVRIHNERKTIRKQGECLRNTFLKTRIIKPTHIIGAYITNKIRETLKHEDFITRINRCAF